MAAMTFLLLLLLLVSASSSRAQRPGLFLQVYFPRCSQRKVMQAY
jgi:hypothetical protein